MLNCEDEAEAIAEFEECNKPDEGISTSAVFAAENIYQDREQIVRRVYRKFIRSVSNIRTLRQRDGWICRICGRNFSYPPPKHPHPLSMTIDHRVPRTQGGTDELSNLQLTHRMCNLMKHDGVRSARFPTQKHTRWIIRRLLHALRVFGLRGWRRRQVMWDYVPDLVFPEANLAIYVYECVPSEVSTVECRILRKAGWAVIKLGKRDIQVDDYKFIRRIQAVLVTTPGLPHNHSWRGHKSLVSKD